jgi:lysophospholipase L1-like esterase
VVTLPEGMRPYVLSVVGVGGTVRPAAPQPRWLCYGDSIAEGWAASNPGRAWPAVAGRRYGLDVVNLGYAGAARGEMVSAEEIADLPADVISLSYGTNCWTRIQHSAEQVGAGLDAFVDLVRTGHPDTPIVVASPVIRPDAEDQQNGLGATLADLRSVIEARVERRCALDPRLHLVRGGDLLTAEQLADGVHPGDEGHRVLAEAIGSAVRASLDAAEITVASASASAASASATAHSDSAAPGSQA